MLEELVAQPHCIHVHVKSCNKNMFKLLPGTVSSGLKLVERPLKNSPSYMNTSELHIAFLNLVKKKHCRSQ